MTRNDLDAIQDRQAKASAVFISEGIYPLNAQTLIGQDITALIAEIRELRTWQEAVALGTGYAEEAHGLINIAPAQVIVDGFREATLGGPEEIPRVDNPVQKDPTYDDLIASAAVDNATRTDDPTDDAGYDYPACDRGPCSRQHGHEGRCLP